MATASQVGRGISRIDHRWVNIEMREDGLYIDGRFGSPYRAKEGDISAANHTLIEVLDEVRWKINEQTRMLLARYNRGSSPENLPEELRQQAISFEEETFNSWLSRLRKISTNHYKPVMDPGAWRYLAAVTAEHPDQPLAITVGGSRFPIMWEMFYTKPQSTPLDPVHFWGFKHLITRDLATALHPLRSRIYASKILFGKYKKLVFVSEEERTLKLIAMQRRFPFSNLEDELRNKLAGKPYSDLDQELFYILKHVEAQLMHFACHTRDTAELVLSLDERDYNLPLGSLHSYEDLSNPETDYGFRQRPLIFLNTCVASDVQQTLTMRDFTTDLLAFNAGGVISTICAVPDIFASMFAVELYKRLFGLKITGSGENRQVSPDRPMSMGKALLDTRLYFLKQYNNPLGLAYTSYALNELHIA